jgi:hypothetical protein
MFCNICKKEFTTEIKPNGKEYKTCLSCREKNKEKRERNRCIHGKQRSRCKECGGSQICEHGKQRSRCKDCGGSQICIHGKQRPQCKDCGGGGICIHGKQRSICKECGGSQICIHGKQRSICKDCGGSQICIHGKQRSTCKDCGGSQICIHGKIRSKCKDCGGGGICIHGKQRSICKECGGSQICIHGKIRPTCTPSRACKNCEHTYVAPSYRFHPYCFTCYCLLNPDEEIPRKYKLKEHHFREFLTEEYKEVKLIFDKRVGESNRRPDVLIPFGEYNIVIEVDENQHRGYDCENRRTMEIFQDLGNKPMVVIRLNPDCYLDSFGKRVPSCFKITKTVGWKRDETEWKRRLDIVKEHIDYYMRNNPEKELTLLYLFYDETSDDEE